MDFKSKIFLIYGPTASGKSDFAIKTSFSDCWYSSFTIIKSGLFFFEISIALLKLLGRVKSLEDGNDKYTNILKNNFPRNFHLKGTKIVLDCANGACYKAAPKLLKELGAKVISIGVKPNGLNIIQPRNLLNQ